MKAEMDNNHNLENGHLSMLTSILFATFAWIASHDVSELIKSGAGIVAIVSGVMAIRYYYYATIKAKK